MSSKKEKLTCPICGSERLNKADELNPDYVCCNCGEILFGLTPKTLRKTDKHNKQLSVTILTNKESAIISESAK